MPPESAAMYAFALTLMAAGIAFALPLDSVQASVRSVVIGVAVGALPPYTLNELLMALGMLLLMATADMIARRNCCPPCPPPPPPETDWTHPHYPCPGVHWHYWVYNQNPVTCKCYLSPRLFGGCGPAP